MEIFKRKRKEQNNGAVDFRILKLPLIYYFASSFKIIFHFINLKNLINDLPHELNCDLRTECFEPSISIVDPRQSESIDLIW